jgi:hypothetical protein
MSCDNASPDIKKPQPRTLTSRRTSYGKQRVLVAGRMARLTRHNVTNTENTHYQESSIGLFRLCVPSSDLWMVYRSWHTMSVRAGFIRRSYNRRPDAGKAEHAIIRPYLD